MAVQARTKGSSFDTSRYHGLSRDKLIRMYRMMYLSRKLDDREIQLRQQSKTRSAVRATRVCWWLRGKSCGRDTTGFFPTIATGPCV
jgi:hypothetical protein